MKLNRMDDWFVYPVYISSVWEMYKSGAGAIEI